MSTLKVLIYFVSGLLIICGAVCLGLGYFSSSMQALGAAVLFLCFGLAGVLLGFYLDAIKRSFENTQGTMRSE